MQPPAPDETGRPDRSVWSGLLRFLRRRPPVAPGGGRPTHLIVGLGNPGPDYADTRHNAGFVVVDRIAERVGGVTWAEAASSLVAEAAWEGHRLALAKPLTFMNRSGQAYRALLKRYGLEPESALVVYDDLALPVGALRLRPSGSAGGHNGVGSVIRYLNSKDFPRLRLGVGDSFPHGGQVQYVLEPFSDEQRPAFAEAAEAAAEAALVFVRDGLTAAMNQYNRRG